MCWFGSSQNLISPSFFRKQTILGLSGAALCVFCHHRLALHVSIEQRYCSGSYISAIAPSPPNNLGHLGDFAGGPVELVLPLDGSGQWKYAAMV